MQPGQTAVADKPDTINFFVVIAVMSIAAKMLSRNFDEIHHGPDAARLGVASQLDFGHVTVVDTDGVGSCQKTLQGFDHLIATAVMDVGVGTFVNTAEIVSQYCAQLLPLLFIDKSEVLCLQYFDRFYIAPLLRHHNNKFCFLTGIGVSIANFGVFSPDFLELYTMVNYCGNIYH